MFLVFQIFFSNVDQKYDSDPELFFSSCGSDPDSDFSKIRSSFFI